MINFRFKKIIDLLILTIVLSIVFITPLFFAVFVKTNNVFELNKIILFKVLMLALLMLTIIKLIFYKNDFYFRLIKALFKNYNYLIIIVFFLFLAIGAINSIDSSLSFYGDYFRQQGLISYVFYFLFFFLVLVNVNTKVQIRKIIWAIILSSVLVSTYGLIQAYGYDPLSWIESTKLRVTSTLGQPNNLGSYLLFTLPLSIYLLINAKKLLVKTAVFIIAVMQVLTLFYSYSTSSWLGLAGGILITVFIYILFKRSTFKNIVRNLNIKKSKRQKPVIISLFIVIIFTFFTFSLFPVQGVFKNRVKNLTNFQTGSTAARLQIWQAAWQGIKAKPWLGYGLETQQEVLAKYYEPDWAVPSNVNVRPSRAHNLFLDILLTQGIIGLAAYLALLYLFFKTIFLNIKKNKQRLLNYCILLPLISYLIYLQFNFHHITTLVYFWLFFALVIIIQYQASESKNTVPQVNSGAERSASGFKFTKFRLIISITLVLTLGAGIVYEINKQFKLLIADYYFFEIRNSRQYNQYFAAIGLYDEIKKIIPRYSYYDQEFGVIMAGWVETFKDPRFRRYGEDKLEEILKQAPDKTYTHFFAKAKIYSALANDERADYYDKAGEYYNKAINISPNMPKNYRELANMHLKQGNYNLAIINYNSALNKLPGLNADGLNTTHKNRIISEMNLDYQGLISAYEELGDEAQAEEYKNKVLEFD